MGSNLTGVGGTTINSNADNRLITGSGTANTLNAESGLTYDGTTLSGNAIQMSGNINASQVGANNILGSVFKIGTTTVISSSRIFYASTRIEIDGGGSWAYTRLTSGGSVMWDIAASPAVSSSALQFRPSGNDANATLMSTSGNWTINGTINSQAITAAGAITKSAKRYPSHTHKYSHTHTHS